MLTNNSHLGVLEWVERESGLFKIQKPDKLCELWSKHKERKKIITYGSLKRSFRLILFLKLLLEL